MYQIHTMYRFSVYHITFEVINKSALGGASNS
jgi:hypothetical protein